jgi:hypothetical protein
LRGAGVTAILYGILYIKELNMTKTIYLAVILGLALVSCPMDSGSSAGKGTPVTGISLDKTELVLGMGHTAKLTATVTPANATDKTVTWISNFEDHLTVNENGVVTAGIRGYPPINAYLSQWVVPDATITATCGDYSASCAVTVKYPLCVWTQVEWTQDDLLNFTGGYNDENAIIITFEDGRFIAYLGRNNYFGIAYEHNKIAYSLDGITWIADIGDNNTFSNPNTAYGNGVFVRGINTHNGHTGINSSKIEVSDDNQFWYTAVENPFGANTYGNNNNYRYINSIAFGNNTFVIGGGRGELAYCIFKEAP